MQISVRPSAAADLARRLDTERDELAERLPHAQSMAERRRAATLTVCRRLFRDLLTGAAEEGITPDTVSALFERSLERKQSGAYYTQADVADYIAHATVIPAVLDRAAALCPQVFGPGGSAWRHLAADPDRAIHADLRHGARLPLPAEVAAGLTDVGRRAAWDTPAPPSHGLAKETWREALARHARYAEARCTLERGLHYPPDDLISLNLNLARVTRDVAAACGAEELEALWRAASGVSVLDPTCGAGAFMLAAARALELIYHACLERADELGAGVGELGEGLAALREGPRRAAGVLATIITRNLRGVDIMPEAAEVCRMRLVLEYAAQLEPGDRAKGAEELLARLAPVVKAGNALVGFDWQGAFDEVALGGFDAVVGNPPYLVFTGTRRVYDVRGYRTAACGNLYALVIERSLGLLREGGRLGMIVPIASVSTGGMAPLQELYAPHAQWHSHFAVRPARLFDGVDMNLTITLLRRGPGAVHSAGYRRWSSGAAGERRHLFTTLGYTRVPDPPEGTNPLPKLGAPIEARLLGRLRAHGRRLGEYAAEQGATIYYHSGGRYWRKALPAKVSSHYKALTVPAELAPAALCLLNSQLFYWYWIVNSNCMDLVAREVLGLPVFALETADPAPFARLSDELLAAYAGGRQTRVRRGARIRVEETNFDVVRARPTIDAIDVLLAEHYGLGADELDFIRSYDIKHRAGLLRRTTSRG
jgi:hypothetical protein